MRCHPNTPRYWDLSQGVSPAKTRVPSLAVMIHQQLTASILAVALLSLGASAIALFRKPGEAQRGFWLMIGLWGLLDGVIVWPSLLGDPMAADELRRILAINLVLQAVYLPTGAILATRPKPLVKGFGWGIIASAVPLAIIDGIFYLRAAG